MSLFEFLFGVKKRQAPKRWEDLSDMELMTAGILGSSYQQQQAASRERQRRQEAEADAYRRRQEKEKREEWVRDRLWYNRSHRNCCPKCFQAGYILALARLNRLDLLAEYPELKDTCQEMDAAGMLVKIQQARPN